MTTRPGLRDCEIARLRDSCVSVFKAPAADASAAGDRQSHLQLKHGLTHASRACEHANRASQQARQHMVLRRWAWRQDMVSGLRLSGAAKSASV